MSDNTTNAATFDEAAGRPDNGRSLPTPRTSPVAPIPTDPADLATIGVEEEFHVVDLHTRELVPRAGSCSTGCPPRRSRPSCTVAWSRPTRRSATPWTRSAPS
ncbi:hypothetical protein GCM10027614_04410 [Micromonospora vulcania]